MKREHVIQMIRQNGDSFLAEANAKGVSPDQLFGVLGSSLKNGFERTQVHVCQISEQRGEPTEVQVDDLIAALLQVATCAELALETLRAPSAPMLTIGVDRDPDRLN